MDSLPMRWVVAVEAGSVDLAVPLHSPDWDMDWECMLAVAEGRLEDLR